MLRLFGVLALHRFPPLYSAALASYSKTSRKPIAGLYSILAVRKHVADYLIVSHHDNVYSMFIPYLAPTATLIVGCMVAFIAWQQWRVAENKLRLDLFDRRYKVYDATRKFLSCIVQEASFSDAQLFEFYGGTSDAKFLFGPEVVDYLAEIRKRALEMRKHKKVYEPLPVGEERSRHVQAECDELLWLSEQLTAMTKIFMPYLGFSHIR